MLKKFLNTTDNFLCTSIKNSFALAETKYKNNNIEVDLVSELKKFEENPLGCMIGVNSNFEAAIKVKIKLILAFFFVIIPLVGLSAVAYLINTPLEVAFLLTFLIALLVASRVEELSKRYTQARMLELQRV